MDGVALFRPDSLAIPPDIRILKGSDFSNLLTAEEVLAEAHRRAEAIEQSARAAYDAEKVRGYADGKAEAITELTTEMRRLSRDAEAGLLRIEQALVSVVVDSVRKLLGDIDVADSAAALIGQALNNLRNQSAITIRVAAAEAPAIRPRLNRLFQAQTELLEEGTVFEVEADQNLAPGSCLLTTDFGFLDLSLKTQLDALERALRETCGHPSSAADLATPDPTTPQQVDLEEGVAGV